MKELTIREKRALELSKKREEYKLDILPNKLIKLYEREEEKVYKKHNLILDNAWDKNIAYSIIISIVLASYSVLSLINGNDKDIVFACLVLSLIIVIGSLSSSMLVIVRNSQKKNISKNKKELLDKQVSNNFIKKVRIIYPEYNSIEFDIKKITF